jgi:hypothetical protein
MQNGRISAEPVEVELGAGRGSEVRGSGPAEGRMDGGSTGGGAAEGGEEWRLLSPRQTHILTLMQTQCFYRFTVYIVHVSSVHVVFQDSYWNVSQILSRFIKLQFRKTAQIGIVDKWSSS